MRCARGAGCQPRSIVCCACLAETGCWQLEQLLKPSVQMRVAVVVVVVVMWWYGDVSVFVRHCPAHEFVDGAWVAGGMFGGIPHPQ